MRFNTLLISILALALVAQAEVKSKKGPMRLMKTAGGSDLVCEVPFGNTAAVQKTEGSYTLVKAGCGEGYVATADIAIVKNDGPKGKSMQLDNVDIMGWMDDPSAVFVLDQNASDDDAINMNRNFTDLLRSTQDREKTEFRNGEN